MERKTVNLNGHRWTHCPIKCLSFSHFFFKFFYFIGMKKISKKRTKKLNFFVLN